MSNRNRPLVACFFLLIVGEFTVAVVSYSNSTRAHLFSENSAKVIPLVRATAGVGALVDSALAFALIALLYQRKNEFKQMNSQIDRMNHSLGTGLLTEAWAYIIGTGLITGACALAGLLSSWIWPKNFVFILFLEMLPKCALFTSMFS